MTTTTRSELLATLAQLGELYPPMRFGQLLCMACSMAGEPYPPRVEEPTDDAVLAVVKEHLQERAEQLEINGSPPEVSQGRKELIQALEAASDNHPQRSLGQLVSSLAAFARSNAYDVEDHQLLGAAAGGAETSGT